MSSKYSTEDEIKHSKTLIESEPKRQEIREGSSLHSSYDQYSRSSRYNRSHSPRRYERSPSSRYDKSRSPRRYERTSSPRRYDRSRSPRRYDSSRSPRRYERTSSPRRYDRSLSPRRYERSPSSRYDRSRSPRRYERTSSPRRYDRSRSPRYKRSRSPYNHHSNSSYSSKKSKYNDDDEEYYSRRKEREKEILSKIEEKRRINNEKRREGYEERKHVFHEAKTIPPLYTIHKGVVKGVREYGIFVKIPGYSQQGFVHISQISDYKIKSNEINDVISIEDEVYVKVIKIDNLEKYSLSIKYVNQRTGEDLDPNLIKLTKEQDFKKKVNHYEEKEPEQTDAYVDTICTRCGTYGHLAAECVVNLKLPQKKYEMIIDPDDFKPSKSSKEKKSKKKDKKRKKDKKA